jgi:hypothetical protein
MGLSEVIISMKTLVLVGSFLALFGNSAYANSTYDCVHIQSQQKVVLVDATKSPPVVRELYVGALSGQEKLGPKLKFLEEDNRQVYVYGVVSMGRTTTTLTVNTATAQPLVIVYERNHEDATTQASELECRVRL